VGYGVVVNVKEVNSTRLTETVAFREKVPGKETNSVAFVELSIVADDRTVATLFDKESNVSELES